MEDDLMKRTPHPDAKPMGRLQHRPAMTDSLANRKASSTAQSTPQKHIVREADRLYGTTFLPVQPTRLYR